MGNESFDGQALAEKLSKLNNSQQSIESLSRWCISHRKKAKHIVETWEKYFNSSQKEQRISFLYLANDILQNSRRKGSEFVNEFWKVLPAALKHVYENGESGKKVVTRLVDIWEGRKVFGSRGQSLKDEMLAKNPPPLSVSQVKSSNVIKIVKRDAHSVRIKLAVGGLPEKIISAFESVLDEHLNEEAVLNKCNTAFQCIGKIEEGVEKSMTQGNQLGSGLQDELQEQEDVLNLCVEKLDSAEANRISLVSLLKEALQEQESRLAHIRSQLQVARRQIDHARNIRTGTPSPVPTASINATNSTSATTTAFEQSQPLSQPGSTQSQPLVQPAISFAPLKTSDEDTKKAAAAAVAARLAASTSSALMLTSVLSSLVAEEAASMNGGPSGLPMFSPEKRQKLEKPTSFPSDASNSEAGGALGFFTPMSGGNSMQPTFSTPPLLPPPPAPLSQSATTPPNQYVQGAGLVPGVMPFGYGSNMLPPPPPMPPHFSVGMARPNTQPQPQHSPQQQQQPLQPHNGGFYRPPGMGFYGQSHQPTTPPVHRQ